MAIEAIGIPATIDIYQSIVAAGGVTANVGVLGNTVELHLEKLWERNITPTIRLLDTVTTPLVLKTDPSGRLQPKQLITHHFKLSDGDARLWNIRPRRKRKSAESDPGQRWRLRTNVRPSTAGARATTTLMGYAYSRLGAAGILDSVPSTPHISDGHRQLSIV